MIAGMALGWHKVLLACNVAMVEGSGRRRQVRFQEGSLEAT